MTRNRDAIKDIFTSKEMWKTLSEVGSLLEWKGTYSTPTKVFALKALSNLIFLSENIQTFCKQEAFLSGIVSAINEDVSSLSDLQYILHRLLFILTAVNEDIKNIVVDKFNGRQVLQKCLKAIIAKFRTANTPTPSQRRIFSVSEGMVLNEILKSLFSLNMHLRKDTLFEQDTIHVMHDLLSSCRKCLLSRCEDDANLTYSVHGNAGNIIYSVPGPCFNDVLLIPKITPSCIDDEWSYNGDGLEIDKERDMSAITSLLNLLSKKMSESKPSAHNLQPILSLLSCLSQMSSNIRRYCKSKVLPPRHDFKSRPESGDKLQNKLIKMFTHVNTEVKGVAADFVFVLCKENVDRFVKYTGFGNAAGLLASRGLLAGGKGNTTYSDSDSDSDTEEYIANAEKINPVTGHIPPPRPNPMEGMSDEQKEYLAVKLATELNKLSSDDIIQPVCVGEDGKLVPIQQKVFETKLSEDEDSD